MDDRGRDERELVRRCREGSEAAYAELVRRHRPRLYALAYRLSNDRETAEDVVQETFLAAFKSIEKVEPNPSLVPWLNTIAVRVAGRAVSRQMARPHTSLDRLADSDGHDDGARPLGTLAMLDPATDPHAAAETAELRRDLSEAIARLPFTYRAAVVLRHVLGLDYAEAAHTQGVPLNTFKSNLLRGTRILREQLASSLDAGIKAEASLVGPQLTQHKAPADDTGDRVAVVDGRRAEPHIAGALTDPVALRSERPARG